jgi:hypothetical protein
MEEEFGCVHPFYSMTAYAVKQDVKPDGRAEFQIHFRCKLCGANMIMLSMAHAANQKEREQVENQHGELREDPFPGYG